MGVRCKECKEKGLCVLRTAIPSGTKIKVPMAARARAGRPVREAWALARKPVATAPMSVPSLKKQGCKN